MKAGRTRVAIACQGGGSHTAFTAGVLAELFGEVTATHEIVGISGTSGGAICALLAWYALVEGDPSRAEDLLEAFWADNSATTPWEQFVNASMIMAGDLQQFLVLPSVSPYDNLLSETAADEFKRMLHRHVDFERIEERRRAARQPDSATLLIGAVDVLSGEFRVFDSRTDEISATTVLASAAIPTLFRAVHIDGRSYWDGLFSQNPPVRELIDLAPDEIWVIQINPTERETEPQTMLDIADRRNELSGNLSLYQELHFVEKIDELLEGGLLVPNDRYRSIVVRIVELSPSRIPRTQSAHSKMDRDPGFIRDLIAHGREQAAEFIAALAFERAWRAADDGDLLALFADDVKFASSPPFPEAESTVGAAELAAFLREHRSNLEIDATRKQVTRDRVTWTVRLPPGEAGERVRGQAELTLRDGRVASIRLGAGRAGSRR